MLSLSSVRTFDVMMIVVWALYEHVRMDIYGMLEFILTIWNIKMDKISTFETLFIHCDFAGFLYQSRKILFRAQHSSS